jgi:hypothetical protein
VHTCNCDEGAVSITLVSLGNADPMCHGHMGILKPAALTFGYQTKWSRATGALVNLLACARSLWSLTELDFSFSSPTTIALISLASASQNPARSSRGQEFGRHATRGPLANEPKNAGASSFIRLPQELFNPLESPILRRCHLK